jgi:hypothetical protein
MEEMKVSIREKAIIIPSPLNLRIKARNLNTKFWHDGVFATNGAETGQNFRQWLKTSSLIESSVFRLQIFVNNKP